MVDATISVAEVAAMTGIVNLEPQYQGFMDQARAAHGSAWTGSPAQFSRLRSVGKDRMPMANRWSHHTLAGDIHVRGRIQLSPPRYQGRDPSMQTVYTELNAGIAGADIVGSLRPKTSRRRVRRVSPT